MARHCNQADTSMNSDLAQNPSFRGQYRHLAFGYGSGAEAVKLTIPAMSTLTDAYHGAFRVFVDIRIDAFATGQSTATVLSSTAFELTASSVAGGYLLTLAASNGLSVTNVANVVQFGRWVRVAFGYQNVSNVGLFLATQPWDLSGGRFLVDGNSMPQWTCGRKTVGLQLLSTGGTSLELGVRRDVPATRIRGGIDNVAVYNFVGDPAKYPSRLTLSACQEVP